MADVRYEEVVRLADQLSPSEQKALIAYLQDVAKQRELTQDEWNAAIDAVKVSIPPGPSFSDRRADWYDDNGR